MKHYQDLDTFQSRLAEVEEDIRRLCAFIHSHPELGFEEYQSSEAAADLLERHGFRVERGCGGMPTAFRAEKAGDKPGPAVGLLCEYDALPGMGHACGHNLIASGSIGAALVASAYLKELGGRVVVLGTPSEEGAGGGKALLLRAGCMEGLDCALMIHPGFKTMSRDKFLAISEFSYTFHGRAAHSAGNPEDGINALEAVLQMFASVNGLRAYLTKDVNVHGIITEGGVAPNIVPERAQAQFALRALTRQGLDRVIERVNACAKGAAMATGCSLEIDEIGEGYDDMVVNDTLSDILLESYHALGIPVCERGPEDGMGSTDAGNVSQCIPTVHGMMSVGDPDARMHTSKFQALAGGENGAWVALDIARSLGLTAVHLLEEPILLQRAWEEQKGKTGHER